MVSEYVESSTLPELSEIHLNELIFIGIMQQTSLFDDSVLCPVQSRRFYLMQMC